MKMEDLNSPTPELEVNGITVTFKKFSLYEKAWCIANFATKEQPNGLAILAEGLQKLDPLIVSRFAWRLVDNKRDITSKDFYDFAEDHKNLLQILVIVNAVLEMSRPSQKANEKMQELKKS
jgi:hypothetical protein